MALRNIVEDGDSVLRKVCRPVTKFDGRLAQMLDDMKETLGEANGLGLAAPQVGVLRRAFVMLEEPEVDVAEEGADAQAGAGQDETGADAGAQDAAGKAGGVSEADGAAGDNAADEGTGAPGENEMPEELPPVFIEFINPEILETEGEVRGYEGCLSFPGKYAAIARPTRVRIRAQDRSGETFEYEATGMLARCLCHETNHLDGVTIDQLAEYFYDPEVPHDLDEKDED